MYRNFIHRGEEKMKEKEETLYVKEHTNNKKNIENTIIKYVKKLSQKNLDKLLEYLNYLIAN